jgi:hypothetical protein
LQPRWRFSCSWFRPSGSLAPSEGASMARNFPHLAISDENAPLLIILQRAQHMTEAKGFRNGTKVLCHHF